MNKTLKAALAGVAAVLIAAPALAGSDKAGTSAANFLAVGAGPAVLGMGGAALGRSGGLDLAAWNPGALGFVDETSLQLAHSSLDDQTMQEWATLGGRFGKSGTHWAMSALYQNEGLIDGRDASNFATESFNVGSGAGMLQLAQAFGPHVAAGMTGKYVIENLGPGNVGTGMTFDGGVSMRFGRVGLGFAAQNVGGGMKFGAQTFPFPSSYGAGMSVTHPGTGITAACDVNMPSTSYTDVRSGVEWMWKQRVALRAGYRMELGAPSDEPLSGPTFGTGLGGHGMWLDYGFVLGGNEGGQHRLAITLRPRGMNFKTGDPFGQNSMPREFDPPTASTNKQVGPPVAPATKDTTKH